LDVKDRNKLILEILAGGALYERDAILEGKRRRLSRLRMIRGIKALEKAGKVVWIKRDKSHRAVWALKKHEEKAKEKAEQVPRIIPLEFRRIHSEKLKREIIRPWIDQLPNVGFDEIYCSFPGESLRILFKLGTGLEVERQVLFNDFRNHVCFDPDPFKLWGSFREKVKEFWEIREEVTCEAKEWIEREIGMEVDPQLAEWVVKACKMALEDEEAFTKQYVAFCSRVVPSAKRGEDKLEYWVSTYMGPRMSSKETDKARARALQLSPPRRWQMGSLSPASSASQGARRLVRSGKCLCGGRKPRSPRRRLSAQNP
jgi:hypothetical protein